MIACSLSSIVGFPAILRVLTVIRPETLVRWHRAGFRCYWRWKSRPQGGRPQIDTELRGLIRRMSMENPLWGCVTSITSPLGDVQLYDVSSVTGAFASISGSWQQLGGCTKGIHQAICRAREGGSIAVRKNTPEGNATGEKVMSLMSASRRDWLVQLGGTR